MRTKLAASAVLCLVLAGGFAARARADALVIDTLELGAWQGAVASLEGDLAGQGKSVHVVVHDAGGAALACGAYALQLDGVGSRAFVLGACDPATGATVVTLVRRDELFSHDGVIPRPRVVGITAIEVLSGGASGGAGMQSGSTMHCTIEVHPYVVDQEHGTRVALFAPRFALRVHDTDVSSVPTATGWSLGSDAAGALSIGYDVVDAQTGEVVLRDRASLLCGGAPEAAVPVVTAGPLVTTGPGVVAVPSGASWVSGGVLVGTSTATPAVHPDVRDPATPVAHDDTLGMWVGVSMHVYSSNLLGLAHVSTTTGSRTAPIDPMAFAQFDFGMRFHLERWLYAGIEWGMIGTGGAIGPQPSDALAMSFGGLLGMRTTGGPVSLFAELLGGGAFVTGDVATRVDGVARRVSSDSVFGVVDARVGVEMGLGDGLYASAHFGLDVLDPASFGGGLAFGFRA